MKCVVTGTETSNKWNNYPVCRNAMIEARTYREKFGGSMREALQVVQKEFQRVLNEKVRDHVDQKIKEKLNEKPHVVGE